MTVSSFPIGPGSAPGKPSGGAAAGGGPVRGRRASRATDRSSGTRLPRLRTEPGPGEERSLGPRCRTYNRPCRAYVGWAHGRCPQEGRCSRPLSGWAEDNRRSFPWRDRDPFRILVAEVLLQRSRGRPSLPYSKSVRRWPSQALPAPGSQRSPRAIRPLGLVERAETLKALATEVVRLGGVPEPLEGLLELRGRPLRGERDPRGRLRRACAGRRRCHRPCLPSVLRARWRRPRLHATRRSGISSSGSPRGPHVREWNWAVLDWPPRSVCRRSRAVAMCPLSTRCAGHGPAVDPCPRRVLGIRTVGSQPCDLPPTRLPRRVCWHAAQDRHAGATRNGSSSCSRASADSASVSKRAGWRTVIWATSGSPPRRPSTPSTATSAISRLASTSTKTSTSSSTRSTRANRAIPDHDLLVGGFPCQDYSVAKTLNQAHGIEGKKGVLWWQIYRILEEKRPRFVFLENVDRLLKSPARSEARLRHHPRVPVRPRVPGRVARRERRRLRLPAAPPPGLHRGPPRR